VQTAVLKRVLAPTIATAVLSSAVSVALSLATSRWTNWWAWVAVAVLTVASGLVATWLYSRQTAQAGAAAGDGLNEATIGDGSELDEGLLEGRRNRFVAGHRTRTGKLTMRAGAAAEPAREEHERRA
jgi:hypothetical protein